jgi:hypothetical protein
MFIIQGDFMENYRCSAANCDMCNTCNHFNVKKFDEEDDEIIIDEDLSDICLPKYKLYTNYKDKPYQKYPCKEVYKELFSFYDNECDGESCLYKKAYDKTIIMQSSCVECKLGEDITCTNSNHPTNKAIDKIIECIEAENKAFEDAGITEGTVTYTCPICGGEAIGNRYLYEGSYHGLGSGCKNCGSWHT